MQMEKMLLACLLVAQTHAVFNMLRQEDGTAQSAKKFIAVINHSGRSRSSSAVQQAQVNLQQDNTTASTCATQCTFNVQISMLHSKEKSPNFKTVQIKGCKGETFQLGGCSDVGQAAGACINEENSPGGVRELKNSRGDVVGYGSCCRDDIKDSIQEMSTAFCSEAQNSPTLTPSSQEAVEGSVSDQPQAAGSSWRWPWTRTAGDKATSIGQEIGILSSKYKGIALLGACFSMTLVAIACSAWLMYAHFKNGMQIIPGLHKAHESSETVISLLWGVPVFGIFGLVSLMMPELATVWQFMQALVIASALRRMPEMFVQAGGGRLELQRSLQSAEEEGRTGYVHIFTQLPFCFLRPCIPSKKPAMADINDLSSGVFVLCMMLPVLSFVQMVISLEAGFASTQLTAIAPGVATFLRMMEVMFIAMAMAALRGIDALVQTLNPKALLEANLGMKQAFCQTFLGGMRLLPIAVHVIQSLSGEGALKDSPIADAARSSIICTAALACAILSLRAFPTSAAQKPQGSLKAGLEQVKFCPFCGSSDLELEAGTQSASCPQCLARHVPLVLVVHRGGDKPALINASAKLGPGSADGLVMEGSAVLSRMAAECD